MSVELTLASEISAILVLAAIPGLIARQTGQPTIVAYILTGHTAQTTIDYFLSYELNRANRMPAATRVTKRVEIAGADHSYLYTASRCLLNPKQHGS